MAVSASELERLRQQSALTFGGQAAYRQALADYNAVNPAPKAPGKIPGPLPPVTTSPGIINGATNKDPAKTGVIPGTKPPVDVGKAPTKIGTPTIQPGTQPGMTVPTDKPGKPAITAAELERLRQQSAQTFEGQWAYRNALAEFNAQGGGTTAIPPQPTGDTISTGQPSNWQFSPQPQPKPAGGPAPETKPPVDVAPGIINGGGVSAVPPKPVGQPISVPPVPATTSAAVTPAPTTTPVAPTTAAPAPAGQPSSGLISINPGTPFTGYEAQPAEAERAAGVGYEASPYEVTPDQTVAGQVEKVIREGGPLQEQAQAQSAQASNARGLINSSMGVQAGQAALYQAALPIATQDASTYANAATNTAGARNAASQFGATATNAASGLNAQLGTGTNQANAAAVNAARANAAAAANTGGLQTAQIRSAADLQRMQSDTSLTIAEKQAQTVKYQTDVNAGLQTQLQSGQITSAQYIAGLQSSTSKEIARINAQNNLDVATKQGLTQTTIATMQTSMQKTIADIQSDTTKTVAQRQGEIATLLNTADNENRLAIQRISSDTSMKLGELQGAVQTSIATNNNTTQLRLQAIQSDTTLDVAKRQIRAQEALNAADNANRELIAGIQRNTSLSVADMQRQTSLATNSLDNSTRIELQQMVTEGNLQQISANGVISTTLANINGHYQQLFNASQGATQLYQQSISQIAAIMRDPNVTDKDTAANNIIATMNTGLEAIGLATGLTTDPANAAAFREWLNGVLKFSGGAATSPATGGTAPATTPPAETPEEIPGSEGAAGD